MREAAESAETDDFDPQIGKCGMFYFVNSALTDKPPLQMLPLGVRRRLFKWGKLRTRFGFLFALFAFLIPYAGFEAHGRS